jgi:insulin-like growth factor-binding protein complex acid labile subunit
MLDLSKNDFTSIPSDLENFEFLQYLDMSENQISRLKGTSLKGLAGLRLLNLSKNNISSWSAINPRSLLEPAISLTELSLSDNPLTSFSTNDDSLLIVSDSLRLLDLSHCKITKVTGQQVLQGMKELKHLNLAGNHIRSVSDLISDTLMTLDLSHNKLTNLLPNMLLNLPALTYIDLSRNHRISLQTKQGEYVQSISLKRIDLSYCNMDNIELEGFPALMTAILKGNMIRELTKETFINTKMIENLDLSQNSVNSVDTSTFKKLKHLKVLNLSFNMIPKIERETFKENELLTKLDLSRNTVNRLNRINAPNLTHLNMTWCQIMTIDPDAISGMPELVQLDLSNNLINDIPDTLFSENLQTLDLSMNRMTNIRNATFAGFPDIAKIDLSGNRFTVPFKKDFFAENLYLAELFLGDNPWLCNCHDMYVFYLYITDAPAKVWEKQSLRCQSPEDVAGRTWVS